MYDFRVETATLGGIILRHTTNERESAPDSEKSLRSVRRTSQESREEDIEQQQQQQQLHQLL